MTRRFLIVCLCLAVFGCDDKTNNATRPFDANDSADATSDADTNSTRDTGTTPDSNSRLDQGEIEPDAEPDSFRPDFGDPIPGSIRFYGNGGLRGDRILIEVDDPSNNDAGPPIDVGATDFTIEFWMRAEPGANPNPAINCGPTNDWVRSNIIIDRDRHSQPPSYGIGIANDRIVWAVQNENSSAYSNCGTSVVTDNVWHHVAVGWRANDGRMWIWVDGNLDFEGEGPPGNVAYPDDGVPMDVCPDGVCDYSDPFLCFGAEKHGYGDISYNGLLDEVRISTGLRYTAPFPRPTARFQPDPETVGLYHFDEGSGLVTRDSSGVAGAAQDGQLIRGGNPMGPDWSTESPF